MAETRLYVPVANRVLTKHLEAYADRFDQLANPYIVIYVERCFAPEILEEYLQNLKSNLAWLGERGYDTMVWIQAFGFGNPLAGRDAQCAESFTRITDLEGHICGDAMCPTSEEFMSFYRKLVKGVVQAGAKRIMLDDDLCLSVRPGLGCACDEHLRRFEQRIGRKVSREELKEKLFSGRPDELRREWLSLMGDTMKDFCCEVRAAADEVNPEVEIGYCAGYTSWDIEGADAAELTRILAGRHQPFLRLTGAPYWVESRRFPGQHLAQIVEFTRMQRQWCEGTGIEIFTENDSYPRPCHKVPAAILETFDFCMSADSTIGQLKYLFDYYSRPGYEDGYLRAHQRNEALISDVRRRIGPMEDTGVWVHEEMRKIADMPLSEQAASAFETMMTAFSSAASLLSSCSVPVTYRKHDGVACVFGDGGRTIPLEERKGYIIDYAAACALQERGVDTGLVSAERAETPGTEYFLAEEDAVLLEGSVRGGAPESFHRCVLAPGAQVESVFCLPEGEIPASYRYENAAGQKFFVLLFDGIAVMNNSALSCSYHRQAQLAAACEWMGMKLPALVRHQPDFYLICKRAEQEMAVAFCNFSPDIAQDAVMELDGKWQEAEWLGCSGRLEGDRVLLSDVPGWSFGAVILRK